MCIRFRLGGHDIKGLAAPVPDFKSGAGQRVGLNCLLCRVGGFGFLHVGFAAAGGQCRIRKYEHQKHERKGSFQFHLDYSPLQNEFDGGICIQYTINLYCKIE